MKLSTFIHRPVLSTVISIFIVLFGVIGLYSLPISQYPDIAPPTINVSATYTGANAQTVLKSVIAPLEDQINGAKNMTYMSSKATNQGTAEISVYFEQGYDPDLAQIDVQNRVSQASGLLPSEVTKIGVTTQKRQSSMLLIMALADTAGIYDSKFVDNYMQINIIPEIKRVSGVGEAMVLGANYSMRIWLKPDKMAAYGLEPSDVVALLDEQNIEASPGQFGERGNQTYQYVMRYKGRLVEEKEFEDIVIKSKENGEIIYLKDIADVELGRVDYSFNATFNGKTAVSALIYQSPGSNATETINNIEKILEQQKKELPKGLDIQIAMNQNDFLYASMNTVEHTLFEAFVLVFIVVYIFLQDLRSTLIPAIAIPVALIGTFACIYMIGFSLNLLTLAALVLAIAIVVDDAIVVVEAVHAKLDDGYTDTTLASDDAMAEIGSAIISITLVMMLVFVPVSFMPGTSGVFYRQFGLTMAFSIAISALNALTLSPALCAIFLKPHGEGHSDKPKNIVQRFHEGFNNKYNKLLEWYKKVVTFFIHSKLVTAAVIGASVIGLYFLMQSTPSSLVPTEDTGTLFAVISTPPATSKEKTEIVAKKVDAMLSQIQAINSRTVVLGYSFVSGQGSNYASIIINLKNWSLRPDHKDSAPALLKQMYGMTASIKEAQVLFFQPPMIQGYSMTNGLEFQMQDKTGGDITKFYNIAQGLIGKLNQSPEFTMAYSTFDPSYPQYMVEIDVAKCKRAGISPSSLLTTMQGYYGGIYASNFNRFGKLYRVMIQAAPESRASESSLNEVKVRMSNGEMAPIMSFITLKRVYGPDIINRFNLFTSIPVTATVAPGYTSGSAIARLKQIAAETLPQGYSYEFSGLTREEAGESAGMTGIIMGLCLLFVYLLLSAQYESYVLPMAVILSIPFGLLGTFLFANIFAACWNDSISNNIYLKIALIMLIGLLAKNAILIVEFALGRRRTGMSIVNAAIAGAAARLRPILMTSMAMIVGLLPLMFAHGVGANGNSTLGTGAVGGMLIGTMLQVFIVPCLFVIFQSLQEKIKPLKWKDTNPTEVTKEFEQYSLKRNIKE